MRKIDLEDLTEKVFINIHPLLDSFDIEYNDINKSKICLPCPIHGGDNKTGVSILLNRKVWNCWTHNCHEEYGRNIFGFVQGLLSVKQNKKASFKEALSYLTNIYGSKLCYKKINKNFENNNLDFIKIAKLLEKEEKIDSVLYESLDLKIPSEYFIKRGFMQETLIYFEVGESIVSKNRAMIPIHDKNAILVGYIGRSTKPYITPKFIFSNGINKTDYLYNYHRAINHIKNKNSIIVVEGQGDVWRLYESGVFNVVGCFGKDPSKQQIELLLESGATNLIVLLDDDEAGRESKFKIQRDLHKLFKINFPSLTKKDTGDLTIQEIKETILPQIKGFY